MKKSILVIACLSGASLFGQNFVFNDSFADGDRIDGVDANDTNWYTTTSSQAIEVSTGSLGLVSGTSGRGIHTVVTPQALAQTGDSLTLRFTFTTPATVGTSKSSSVRFGFFNSNGAAVAQDYTSSTDSAWDVVSGYMMDWDVGTGSENISFRQRNDPTGIGGNDRLLGTTSFFTSLSDGGGAYSFTANTTYNGLLQIAMTGASELTLTGTLADASDVTLSTFSAAVSTDLETTFDLVGLHVNSNVFGSSSSPGDPDNGIDFSNISLEVVPEPSTVSFVMGGLVLAGMMIRRVRRRR